MNTTVEAKHFSKQELVVWSEKIIQLMDELKLDPFQALATLKFVEQFIDAEYGVSTDSGLIGVKTESAS